MARAQGSRAQALLAFESAYGTAPASGYLKVPFASAGIGAAQPLLDSELLGNGRDPFAPVKDAIDVDGDMVVPVCAVSMGYWLKGLLGAPTTTGASAPYTHTFVSGAATLPSMALEIGHPDVPFYSMYSGVKANMLTINMQRKGLITATVGLIAQGETTATSSAAGSPTATVLQRFGSFNGSVQRNGSDLGNIVSANLAYSNTLDRVEVLRDDGKIEGLDEGVATLGGQLVARFDGAALYNQAVDGSSCSLSFSYEISAGVKLTFTAHEVYLPIPKKEVQGPAGVQVTFDWQASKATSPARMMTAVLTNSVAAY
ncbi:phage tail tube protein [Pseudorhodobacter sp.]|uniref:phage tail tube protein n=1 Tax=Pseudorhodobacter sp. TaxID=1934400 RepID=UPI002649894C|nr:phage tail tube protein [Pseudorhodobacter sp.]MDN5786911.1 phage tail tube protein [Pseudorhodobacter sp.]